MSKIINFPEQPQNYIVESPQNEVPEPPQNIVGEAEDMNYEENQHYISRDKCYRCGKTLDFDNLHEHIWYIDQLAGYPSDIDGSQVSIKICDSCMMEFLKK